MQIHALHTQVGATHCAPDAKLHSACPDIQYIQSGANPMLHSCTPDAGVRDLAAQCAQVTQQLGCHRARCCSVGSAFCGSGGITGESAALYNDIAERARCPRAYVLRRAFLSWTAMHGDEPTWVKYTTHMYCRASACPSPACCPAPPSRCWASPSSVACRGCAPSGRSAPSSCR